MQSILKFNYNADGTVERSDTNPLFQGQVGTAEYRFNVAAESDVLTTDTVLISFERPDGEKVSQLMHLSADGEGWSYVSNGWETDTALYAGGGMLKVGFVMLRYSQFDAGRVAKITTTEPISVQVDETAGYTPLEIADDVSSEILATLAQVDAEIKKVDAKIKKRTNIENGPGTGSIQQPIDEYKFTNPNSSSISDEAYGVNNTGAYGTKSVSLGGLNRATGMKAVAEGNKTIAHGHYSHAEGDLSIAKAMDSHAEGSSTIAEGEASHAEGLGAKAKGLSSHAEGRSTEAIGENSHAGGEHTKATGKNQTAIGQYNAVNHEALFLVGNGTSDTARANAIEVLRDGTVKIPGRLDATADKAMCDTVGNRIDTYYTSKEDLAAVIGGAPEAFDTLKEIADWIESDETGTAALVGRVGALESGKASKVELAAVEEVKADRTELTAYATNEKVDSLHQQVLDMDPILQRVQGDTVTLTGTPSGRYLDSKDYKVKLAARQHVSKNLLPYKGDIDQASPSGKISVRSLGNGKYQVDIAGTGETGTNNVIFEVPPTTIKKGTYYMHLRNTGTNANASLAFGNAANASTYYAALSAPTNRIVQFTLEEDVAVDRLNFYAKGDSEASSFVVQPSVELVGTATGYDPYTGEPAPDNPVPIESPSRITARSFGTNLLATEPKIGPTEIQRLTDFGRDITFPSLTVSVDVTNLSMENQTGNAALFGLIKEDGSVSYLAAQRFGLKGDLSPQTGEFSCTITNATFRYIHFYGHPNAYNKLSGTLNWAMVNEGATVLPFAPYQSDVTEFAPKDLNGNPIELFGGVEGAENTIEWIDGKPYWVERSKRYAPTNWIRTGGVNAETGTTYVKTTVGNVSSDEKQFGICTSFKHTTGNNFADWSTGVNIFRTWAIDKSIGIRIRMTDFGINAEDSYEVAAQKFRAWAAANNLEFVISQEPTYTELDPLSLPSLRTYDPQTTIEMSSDVADLNPVIDFTAFSIENAKKIPILMRDEGGNLLYTPTSADLVETAAGQTVQQELDGIREDYATKELVEEKHREWIDMDVPIYDDKRGDLLTIEGTTDGKTVEPNDYAVKFPLRQHISKNLLEKANYQLGRNLSTSGVILTEPVPQTSVFANFIPVKPNTSYTISLTGAASGRVNVISRCCSYSAASESSFVAQFFPSSSNGQVGNFSTGAGVNYVRITLTMADISQTFTQSIMDSLNIMFTEGNSALSYDPYTGEPAPNNPVPIESPISATIETFGGNLLPAANGSVSSNGGTVEGVDGNYTLTVGEMTGEFYKFLYFPSPIKLKPGTYYYHLRNDKTVGPGQTISTVLIQPGSIGKLPASDVSIEGDETDKVKEFQINQEYTISGIAFYAVPASPKGEYQFQLSLELVGGNTEFVPYQTIDQFLAPTDLEGNPIALSGGVPGAENGIEWVDGKPYWVQRTGKVVYDGTEQWNSGNSTGEVTGEYQRFVGFRTLNTAKPASGNEITAKMMCPAYKSVSANDTYVKQQGIAIDTSSRTFVYDNTYSPTGDVAGFKAWLSDNPLTLYYELAEPIYTELDPSSLPTLQTYWPRTTFSTESDVAGLNPTLDLTPLSVRNATFVPTVFRDKSHQEIAPVTVSEAVRMRDGKLLDTTLAELSEQIGEKQGTTVAVGGTAVARVEFTSDPQVQINSKYGPTNKPTAGDVGALPTTGGTVIGSVDATKNLSAGGQVQEAGVRVYSPNNKPTAADVGAVPVTGGSVTGNLTASNLSATQDVTASGIVNGVRQVQENGVRVYSPNNKPTAGDIGAFPAAGGTATGDISAPNLSASGTVNGAQVKEAGVRVYSPNNKPTPQAIGAYGPNNKPALSDISLLSETDVIMEAKGQMTLTAGMTFPQILDSAIDPARYDVSVVEVFPLAAATINNGSTPITDVRVARVTYYPAANNTTVYSPEFVITDGTVWTNPGPLMSIDKFTFESAGNIACYRITYKIRR